jgi:hypothetical protein
MQVDRCCCLHTFPGREPRLLSTPAVMRRWIGSTDEGVGRRMPWERKKTLFGLFRNLAAEKGQTTEDSSIVLVMVATDW